LLLAHRCSLDSTPRSALRDDAVGRPRGGGTIDGFVIALEPSEAGRISLAIYLEAVKRRRVGEFEGALRACDTCGTPSRVRIRFRDEEAQRRRVGCPSCPLPPKTRWCARCLEFRPVELFDISASRRLGFKLESFCNSCRRARAMAHYFDTRDADRDVPAKVQCRDLQASEGGEGIQLRRPIYDGTVRSLRALPE